MSRSGLVTALTVSLLWILACVDAPRSFELVSIEAARELVEAGRVPVVDAFVADQGIPERVPGGLRWPLRADRPLTPPALPAGEVLVIASGQGVAYRSAAALARQGNHPVYVFIPENAAERRTLVALRSQPEEEIQRGRDS